jgi:hypothetical protein
LDVCVYRESVLSFGTLGLFVLLPITYCFLVLLLFSNRLWLLLLIYIHFSYSVLLMRVIRWRSVASYLLKFSPKVVPHCEVT